MALILREYTDLSYDRNLVKESIEKKLPIILKTILQRKDAPNQNHRIYPGQILEREVNNYKKAIAEGRATGELDHPDSSIVSLERVSHIIREVWWNNDEVWGAVEILNTPNGKLAQTLLEAGVKVGISSRGVGDTKKNKDGYDVVDESFMLVAFDLVSEPSTHNAWLHESKQISVDEVRKVIPKVDRVNRIVNEILKGK
jgi:hypothetical protein